MIGKQLFSKAKGKVNMLASVMMHFPLSKVSLMWHAGAACFAQGAGGPWSIYFTRGWHLRVQFSMFGERGQSHKFEGKQQGGFQFGAVEGIWEGAKDAYLCFTGAPMACQRGCCFRPG